MALIKSKVLFVSLLILSTFFGITIGVTVHKVGDSKGWTMMGADYESWSSSRMFQVGDSLVFEYNKDYHDVTEVTPNAFEQCEASEPLGRYQTGFDTINLTKPGVHNFICGVPSHCDIGQKFGILVLPTSLVPIAAPVPRPVRSPSSSPSPLFIPVHLHQNGPSLASHCAASSSSDWIGLGTFSLLCFFILV